MASGLGALMTDDLLRDAAVQHAAGNLSDAEKIYRKILQNSPENMHAHFLLGGVCLQTARPQEAVSHFKKFLEQAPAHLDATLHLAAAFREAGDVPNAEHYFRLCTTLSPDHPRAYFELGNLYQATGRYQEALENFLKSVQLDPSAADAWFNFGVLQYSVKAFAEAETAYRQFLVLRPDSAEGHHNLAAVLFEQGRLQEARDEYLHSLSLNPNLADAYSGLGNIYLLERNYTLAEMNFRRALEFKPADLELLNNLGVILQKLNRLQEAEDCYRQAVAIGREHANSHFNLALVLLLQGRFAEGWQEYEWRQRIKGRMLVVHTQPVWDGGSLAGKAILVQAEQGFGDTFQFVRYLPLVRARGGHVVLECQPGLQRLLRQSDLCGEVVQRTVTGQLDVPFDCHLPLLSLPRVFGTSLATVPADIPYLQAEAWNIDRWRRRFSHDASFKVGVVWAGRPTHEDDQNRSMPLQFFVRLGEVPDVALYSLQKGSAVEALNQLPVAHAVINLDNELEDFADTAAAIMRLDLVITVDTSVAHLAGALGRPVWMLLPYAPDWRWLMEREDCPWYPSMRLFRQAASGNWEEMFTRIKDALGATVASHVSETQVEPDYAPAIVKRLCQGRAALKAGNYSEAIEACSQVLASFPDHAEAHYLTGLSAMSTRHFELAQQHFSGAAETWPEHPGLLKQWGIARQSLLDQEGAAECYRRALEYGNEDAELLYNLGSIALLHGDNVEAIRLLGRALAYRPDFAEALNNRGIALQGCGRLDEAAECFLKAMQAQPAFADAYLNLGKLYCEQAQFQEAVAVFRNALLLQPESAAVYNGLGVALKGMGQVELAHNAFRQALNFSPDSAEIHSNLGNALKSLGDLAGAEASYRAALQLNPDNAHTWTNLGNTLQAAGEIVEALACLEKAVALQPDFAEGHWNLGIAYLLAGNYLAGWREYEWGIAARQRTFPAFSQPRWQGEELAGRAILLCGEQGFGDTIQFSRYAGVLARQGARVILACQKELVGLSSRCAGVDQVLALDDLANEAVQFAYWTPLLSVPTILGTTLENIPQHVPYITAEPAKADYWREKLAGPGLKIGIVWAGRPTHQDDRKRSCALSMFAPLLGLQGALFFSLQKGSACSELREMPEVSDLSPVLHDFTDTAAVIANLDLVISVDTAVAHLAGALGKPVWVLLPYAPDWRWLLSREDSPWYPSARLFRQETAGNWEGVLLRVCDQLRAMQGRG